MNGEPSTVFFETGVLATLRSADGSLTVHARGLFEDGSIDRQTGETTREVDAKHFTGPTELIRSFTEGDTLEITEGEYAGEKRQILDRISDDVQTSFNLSTPIL